MASVKVKKKKERKVSSPYLLARFFERGLQERGVPIRFEANLGRELCHAERLLRACAGSLEEAKALIEEFLRDEWEVKHNWSLSRVVAIADGLRARIAMRQSRAVVAPPREIRRL